MSTDAAAAPRVIGPLEAALTAAWGEGRSGGGGGKRRLLHEARQWDTALASGGGDLDSGCVVRIAIVPGSGGWQWEVDARVPDSYRLGGHERASPYAGLILRHTVTFSPDYPMRPPEIQLAPQQLLFHPLVSSFGVVYAHAVPRIRPLSWLPKCWTPALTLQRMLRTYMATAFVWADTWEPSMSILSAHFTAAAAEAIAPAIVEHWINVGPVPTWLQGDALRVWTADHKVPSPVWGPGDTVSDAELVGRDLWLPPGAADYRPRTDAMRCITVTAPNHSAGVEIWVLPTDTVRWLKAVLQEVTSLPQQRQWFASEGYVLQDDHTMAQCGLGGWDAAPGVVAIPPPGSPARAALASGVAMQLRSDCNGCDSCQTPGNNLVAMALIRCDKIGLFESLAHRSWAMTAAWLRRGPVVVGVALGCVGGDDT